MGVGISAVGVFGTSDGGETWHAMNQGVRADFLPQRFPDFGQCPHKMLAAQGSKDLLYQQNHCGVYRGASGGQDWQDVTRRLPSQFGFALALDPGDPDRLCCPRTRCWGRTSAAAFVTCRKAVPGVPQTQLWRRLGGVDQRPPTGELLFALPSRGDVH